MRYLLVIILFILSVAPASSKEQKDCFQSYKNSLAKKDKRFNKELKRYNHNINAALSTGFSNNIGAQLIGSAYLQNKKMPRRSDYNIYEEEIINATEFNLKKQKTSKPKLLERIYNSAYEKYADVTFEKIQNLMKSGFEKNKFCSFFGKKRARGIERYVLKRLKKESKSSVQVRDPAVANFKEDSDSKTYIYDPVLEKEELYNSLEKEAIEQ